MYKIFKAPLFKSNKALNSYHSIVWMVKIFRLLEINIQIFINLIKINGLVILIDHIIVSIILLIKLEAKLWQLLIKMLLKSQQWMSSRINGKLIMVHAFKKIFNLKLLIIKLKKAGYLTLISHALLILIDYNPRLELF